MRFTAILIAIATVFVAGALASPIPAEKVSLPSEQQPTGLLSSRFVSNGSLLLSHSPTF